MHIKRERQLFIILIIVILLVFLGSITGGIVTFSLLRNGYVGGAAEPIEPIKLKYAPSTTFSSEFQKNLNSSLIKIIKYQDFSKTIPVLDKMWNINEAAAYGFIISLDGWIITSGLDAAGRVEKSFIVLTADGGLFAPQKIINAKSLGLNFIKITGPNFKPPSLGDERSLANGDDIFIIEDKKVFKKSLVHFGYPDRARKKNFILSSEFVGKFLFLEDKLSGRFEGQPIFSKRGEVVGVVNDDGIVLPISLVMANLKSLWKNDKILMPYLGARYLDLSELPFPIEGVGFKKGAYIPKEEPGAVLKDSPAHRFGIKPGDIILSVMGDETNENYNLAERLLEYAPGQKIDLGILRNGEKIEVSVELGEVK